MPACTPAAGLSWSKSGFWLWPWPKERAAGAETTENGLASGWWARMGMRAAVAKEGASVVVPAGRELGLLLPVVLQAGGQQVEVGCGQHRTHGIAGCCWELHWFGLKLKRQESGLTKILFFFFSPLTYCLLCGQNSIESTFEDGLLYGNIVFGYKQLCLEVNISELWDQTGTPT